jgi:hypothetical protein
MAGKAAAEIARSRANVGDGFRLLQSQCHDDLMRLLPGVARGILEDFGVGIGMHVLVVFLVGNLSKQAGSDEASEENGFPHASK